MTRQLCERIHCAPPRRRLMDDLHCLVSSHLEDTFCCFFEDGAALGRGDKAAQVGGPTRPSPGSALAQLGLCCSAAEALLRLIRAQLALLAPRRRCLGVRCRCVPSRRSTSSAAPHTTCSACRAAGTRAPCAGRHAAAACGTVVEPGRGQRAGRAAHAAPAGRGAGAGQQEVRLGGRKGVAPAAVAARTARPADTVAARGDVSCAGAPAACSAAGSHHRRWPSPCPRSAPLLALFATMRLTALLEQEKAGSLEGVSALLGCPFNLFEQVGPPGRELGRAACDHGGAGTASAPPGPRSHLADRQLRAGNCLAATRMQRQHLHVQSVPSSTFRPPTPPPERTPPHLHQPGQVLADPQQFGQLPAEERRCVLLGLWYALNWCRELANCFATQLTPAG